MFSYKFSATKVILVICTYSINKSQRIICASIVLIKKKFLRFSASFLSHWCTADINEC